MVLPKLYSKITCVMRETNLSSDSDSACACLNEQKKKVRQQQLNLFLSPYKYHPKDISYLVYWFTHSIPINSSSPHIYLHSSFSVFFYYTHYYIIFHFFFIISQLCRVQVIVNKFSQLV